MSQESLSNAILKRKAALAELTLVLSRPAHSSRANSRQRLQEKRLHEEEVIADLETQLLLRQYHASWNDPSARAAIEQKLAERGTLLRRPNGSTPIETPSSPIADSSHDRPKQKRESIREKILSDPQGKIRYDEAAAYYGVTRRTIARRVKYKKLGSPSRSFISNASILAYDKKHRLKQL